MQVLLAFSDDRHPARVGEVRGEPRPFVLHLLGAPLPVVEGAGAHVMHMLSQLPEASDLFLQGESF